MKNMKLRPWVVNTLILVNFLSVCIMFGECDDNTIFIIKGIAGLIVFMTNSYILYYLGGLKDGNI